MTRLLAPAVLWLSRRQGWPCDKGERYVARELRYQYLLGYEPSDPIEPRNPSWRSVRVVLKKPGLRVRARRMYGGLILKDRKAQSPEARSPGPL